MTAWRTNKKAEYSRLPSALKPQYTFDNFVVGAPNRLAYEAAKVVAENPETTYNPLFIYGAGAMGKTHLLHAICHTILQAASGSNTCCCSAEKFMRQLIEHIRLNKVDSFRNYFKNLDLLLIDDIQFASGKERTQQELLKTIETLCDAGKQIVIAADNHPAQLAGFDERLPSYFSSGLIVGIEPPDLSARITIIKIHADILKITVPDDVIHFIAAMKYLNIRAMVGALIRLDAYRSLQKIPVNLEMAKEYLRDILLHTKVGIYWSVDDVIVGDAVYLHLAEEYDDALQYGGHYEFWEKLQPRNDAERKLKSHAYDYYPRGRMVCFPKRNTVRLYVDRCMDNDVLQGALEFFEHQKFQIEIETDAHYCCFGCNRHYLE